MINAFRWLQDKLKQAGASPGVSTAMFTVGFAWGIIIAVKFL